MRSRTSVASLLGLALLLVAQPVHAAAILDIIWTATDGPGVTGTSTIYAEPGNTLTATLRLTAGAEGISSYGISLEFDTDGANELALVSATELLPAGFGSNLTSGTVYSTLDSSAGAKGHVKTYEAVTTGNGPVSTTFDIGTAIFTVNGAAEDGPDVFSGFFNDGIDDVFDNSGSAVSVTFNSAIVNPEPSTLLLLGTGFAMLAAARRRGDRPRRG